MRSIVGMLLLFVVGVAQPQNGGSSMEPRTADFRLNTVTKGRDIDVCNPSKKRLKDLSILDANQLAQPDDRVSVCVSAPPPQVAPFGDAIYYVLTSELRYRIEEAGGEVITIPAGFVTDLASIPRPLWAGLPRDGQYMSAAILHDYLYWDQRCKREQADLILLEQMVRFGVRTRKAALVYSGVRLGGQSAWDQNAANKQRQIRVIPNPFLSDFLAGPLDASQSWKKIEQEMRAKGLKPTADAGNTNIASVCQKAAVADAQISR